VIREFLRGRPTSDELREWRQILQERVAALREELPRLAPEERMPLAQRIRQLQETIAALREEEEVTRFVEQSVRVTLAMGAATEQPPEE